MRSADLTLRQVEREGRAVPPESITIRFPTGAWEYGFSETMPEVGESLVRQGKTWVVVGVTESVDDHRVVTMALAPDLVDHDRPDVGTG